MCADILHAGHINIIKHGRELGEVTVGLLTDRAIAAKKRVPYMNYQQRFALVSNVKGVAHVIAQDSVSSLPTVLQMRPDYVVHGDDWQQPGIRAQGRQQLIDAMKEWGGRVVECEYTKGISSTQLQSELRAMQTTSALHTIACTPSVFTTGPITNSSGYIMPLYTDMQAVLSSPISLANVIQAMQDYIGAHNIEFDAIAGIAVSGVPLSAPLAYSLGKRHIVVRSQPKLHGRTDTIIGNFSQGDRVLVIDNSTSNGTTKSKILSTLESEGLIAVSVLTLFARDQKVNQALSAKHNLRVDSLCDMPQLVRYAYEQSIITEQEHRLMSWYMQDPAAWHKDSKKSKFFADYLSASTD